MQGVTWYMIRNAGVTPQDFLPTDGSWDARNERLLRSYPFAPEPVPLQLDLDDAVWKMIPSSLTTLSHRLTELCLCNNLIEVLPEAIFAQLTQLRRLDVSHNRLQWLPMALGRLTHLNTLRVECQRSTADIWFRNGKRTWLSRLPPTIRHLKQLHTLGLKRVMGPTLSKSSSHNTLNDHRLVQLRIRSAAKRARRLPMAACRMLFWMRRTAERNVWTGQALDVVRMIADLVYASANDGNVWDDADMGLPFPRGFLPKRQRVGGD